MHLFNKIESSKVLEHCFGISYILLLEIESDVNRDFLQTKIQYISGEVFT